MPTMLIQHDEADPEVCDVQISELSEQTLSAALDAITGRVSDLEHYQRLDQHADAGLRTRWLRTICRLRHAARTPASLRTVPKQELDRYPLAT